MRHKVIIIGGPTASGKSAIALELAKKLDSIIINADSTQIYKETPIITASPNRIDKLTVPHYLYNIVSLTQSFDIKKWLILATEQINRAITKQKIPIVVGGSGFYINSLINGLSELPDVNPEIRQHVVTTLQNQGKSHILKLLSLADPSNDYGNLDQYRLIRSYETILQSGKPLSFWYQKPKTIYLQHDYLYLKILPPREYIYSNILARFANMIRLGAVNEAMLFYKYPIKQIKKIIGLSEVLDFLEQKTSLQQAITISCQRSRRYAKRQITWFKNQIINENTIIIDSTNMSDILSYVDQNLSYSN